MAPSNNPPPQTITPCPLDLRNRISLLLATKQSKAHSLFGASLPQPTTSSTAKPPAAFSSLASGGQKSNQQESQRRRLEDEDDFSALEPNVGIGAGRDSAAAQKANAAREDLTLKRKLLGKRQREDNRAKYGNGKPDAPAESDDEDEGRSGLGRNKKARRSGPGTVAGRPKEHPLVAAAAAAAAAAKEQAKEQAKGDGEDENGLDGEDSPEGITKSSTEPNESLAGLDANPSEVASKKKKKKKKKKPKKTKTEENTETPGNVTGMEICG